MTDIILTLLGRLPPRTGRTSPVKHQRTGILTAIPESPIPAPRTEVIFTVDAKGKARTETIVVGGRNPSPPKRAPSSTREEWDSSQDESSTDEEPIVVPSRNSSFSLPPTKGPKLTRFEISNTGNEVRRQNTGSQSESSSQHSMQRDSVESEAETMMDEDGGSGDATRELRKLMESRKNKLMTGRKPQHHLYGTDARSGAIYFNSSTNISPTTITDPDGATPSSTRSGTTRCVCNNSDSEGFMIQW